MGEDPAGTDSLAEQVAPQSHWHQLKVLILVVSAEKKAVGSTAGMGTSVATSELLAHRAANIVPGRMQAMEQAIHSKDFETFAKLTMQDSNQFHATCLDTHPPIFYLNDVSRNIINLVHAYNRFCGVIKVAYTFDAGPNACLYMLEDSVAEMGALAQYYFPASGASNLEIKGLQYNSALNEKFVGLYQAPRITDGLSYIISTEVGGDPRVLDESECLLGEDGTPRLST